MTQSEPAPPPPPPGNYQQGPPPKKSHTTRNVILIILGVMLLGLVGCVALVGGAINEVDKAIKEEEANDTTLEKGDPATGSNAKSDSDSDKAQGEIVESGFGQDGQYVYPVTLVKNTSDHAGQTVIVSWNFIDSAGGIVKSESQTDNFNFTGQTIAVTTLVDVGKGVEVASIEPTLLIKDDGLFDETEVDFGTADATVKKGEYGGWTVSFPVKNPTSEPLESPSVGIVCRDAQGKINGAGFTFPDLVPPNGQITADSDVTVSGKPATCKAYIAGPVF